MLQKLKNKIRLLRDKWLNLGNGKKCFLIATIIALVVGIWGAIDDWDNRPQIKEENYSAMHELIQTMIEEKSTDVKFDTSKIRNYTVDNESDGTKYIVIYGNDMECMHLQLSDNFQIKQLKTDNKEWIIFLFWVVYVFLMYGIGYFVAGILLGITALIRKIVKFFKE